ncbi:hypothetical protein SAMN04487857_107115 [Pseudomonas sp. ok272]|nr:hypothetical protein SAMN04487857_107115 [Pseudomonas sp. ok272]SFM94556.1 hypothetical protein SAMN04487858_109101 [Pseudomonas sp. ok602]
MTQPWLATCLLLLGSACVQAADHGLKQISPGRLADRQQYPALDKGCAAETQGASRLIRGHTYFDYLQRRHPPGLNQRLIEVPGVGHNGDKVFTSPEGMKAVFGG